MSAVSGGLSPTDSVTGAAQPAREWAAGCRAADGLCLQDHAETSVYLMVAVPSLHAGPPRGFSASCGAAGGGYFFLQ